MSTYELVEIGKEKQGHTSDRQFALANGLSTQNMVDWKANPKALPSAINLRKLSRAAQMSMEEALAICTGERFLQHELPLQQSGFTTVRSMATLAGMSLAVVTSSPGIALLSGIGGTLHCILCKIDDNELEAANASEYQHNDHLHLEFSSTA